MSLRVWLPLNGTLKQQGLSSATAINSGATVNSAGKIGSCYSFDGTDDRIYANNVSINNSAMSACCWVKFNNLTSSDYPYIFALGSNTSGTGIQIGLAVWKSDSKIHLVGNGSEPSSGYTPPTNTWIHLCITINGATTKLYVNGILTSTQTNANSPKTQTCLCLGARPNSTNGAGTAFSYPINGYINDFRLYDHALSEMEVKELSKGLILHYPLNRNGWGQENMLTNSSGYSGTTDYAGLVTVGNENGKPYLIAKRTDTTSTSRTFCNHSAITSFIGSWPAGSKFTISGYYKIPSTETYAVSANMFIRWNDGGERDTGFSIPTSTIKDKWIRFEHTFTVPSYEAGGISFCLSAFSKGLATIYWKDIKLEYGEKATSWCPNSSDALATTMGLNSTTEYDCSGFGNNGIKNNSPTYSNDTIKYNISTHLDGTNQTIQLPNISTLIPDSIFTFNIWFKRLESDPSAKPWETIFGGPSGFEIETCSANNVHDNKIKAYSWGGGTFSFDFDKWNMLTMVSNGTNALFYLNGELKLTGTYKALVSGNYFIGSWNTTTSQNYKGYVSDVRIYATALSADDVLELYQQKRLN